MLWDLGRRESFGLGFGGQGWRDGGTLKWLGWIEKEISGREKLILNGYVRIETM